MNPIHRLHNLRMENTEAGYAMAEMRPRFDRMANRHENGTAPRAVSAFNLFQTPPELAARMVALLGENVRGHVLEPSAGLGRILDALKPYSPLSVTAVEIAAQCASELFRQQRENVVLLQRDFLAMTPQDFGLFDAAAMNPPFHLRADIRHIQHALTFLKPSGTLVALCLDTPHREKALKPLSTTWEQVKAGTFGKEGTNVPTVMLTIAK